MWIERLAFAGVLGVIVVWLVERFTGHTRSAFNTNAGFVVIIVAAFFVVGVPHQARSCLTSDPEDGERGG